MVFSNTGLRSKLIKRTVLGERQPPQGLYLGSRSFSMRRVFSPAWAQYLAAVDPPVLHPPQSHHNPDPLLGSSIRNEKITTKLRFVNT